jgi:hypothetical protein
MSDNSMTAVVIDVPGGGSTPETGRSAVSWAAILAGAATAVTTTLILLALGTGFGLSAVSPWSAMRTTATTFTVMTAIWLIVTQWIASGMGGYITGRLRTKWTGTHTHEVFFRDTAHGFLTWSVATLIAVVFISSSAVTTARNAADMATDASSKPAAGFAYDVDSLFRSTHPDDPSAAQARAETTTILATSAIAGGVSPNDRDYLVQLVAARTGIDAAAAQTRVDAVVTREQQAVIDAKQAADKARKAAAALAIFTALSMLIGALIASVAAALGGQLRDEHI